VLVVNACERHFPPGKHHYGAFAFYHIVSCLRVKTFNLFGQGGNVALVACPLWRCVALENLMCVQFFMVTSCITNKMI
jgi:hypothetical protein